MQYHIDPYVPRKLRDPKAFAAFHKELVNAVTCCEAVEHSPWTSTGARQVIRRASRRKGHSTVRAVSLPSEPSCTRFMAFEAKEDGHITYIIAFRSDRECYKDMVSNMDVENDNTFQVHKSLWWRAATMPLHSLPPQWRSGLRERRHRLLLTGFSVGGAVAALATLQLLEAEDPDLRQQICCYTFGAPLQGDLNYANCINQKYASNFYHVMINEDPIPGVLTLLSKVSDNQPDICREVASNICTLLASTAQVAACIALDTVAPGAGIILQQVDCAKLGSYVRSLIVTERDSRMPLPEYKFGGSLVLLDRKQHSYNHMWFVQLLGDGRVLEDVFCVQEKNVTLSSLQQLQGVSQLKTFVQVINDLDNLHDLSHAVKNASVEYHITDRISRELVLSHKPDQGTLNHISLNGMMKEYGAKGVVVKSTNCVANAAKSAARYVIEDEEDTSTHRWLLQPQFDAMKPIQVWLDKHENLTIEVYGENMVLGINVVYSVNGKEKLRIPCTEKYMMSQWVDNVSKGPQKPMADAFSNLPLQFSTQGIKGLTFKEPSGCYKIQLAFGSHYVEASKVEPRIFDSLHVLQVAERFSTEPPAKLIDLLIFWGTATAQAQCTAAYYAIQEHPRDADDIVKKTLTELRDVPPEFVLLDRLLSLADTTQFALSVLNRLPPEMSRTLRGTTNASKAKLLVPYFSADNESVIWTFGGCYTRTIERMITKEMLSKKETAERLSASLDNELAEGPKQMIIAYLNHRFEYKSYAREFSFNSIKSWNKEKEVVEDGGRVFAKGGGMLPIVTVPIYYAAVKLDSDVLKYLSMAIGMPTAVITAGLGLTAWWLYHVVSAPLRMYQNKPGLMADWKRIGLVADDWENKLQAAAMLFQCRTEPPHVACRLEFELYVRLKNCEKVPHVGCFNLESMQFTVDRARYEATTALKLANYGLAGARMYEIRRYLTERKTALGLIGTSQAGKSTFAFQAFKVESHPGAGKNARTRVLRHWTLPFPEIANRQFTLIDFPGSTDHAAPHFYIRGQLLASVLVVVLSMKEINSAQAVALVEKASEVRRKDKEVSVLFCFTCADTSYEEYRDEADDMGGETTADQLFTQNYESYKKELLDAASETVGDAVQLAYISSHMYACCFKPKLQDENQRLARELKAVNVKNVDWVKNWCLEHLLRVNRSDSVSRSVSGSTLRP